MKRVLTSLVLIPIVSYVMVWGPEWLFTATTCLFALLCFHEFAGIARASGIALKFAYGTVPGLALLLLKGDTGLIFTMTALLGLVIALRENDLRNSMPMAAAMTLGVAYTFGAWKTAADLHSLSPYWVVFAVTINWVGDSAAYYCGRAIGKHKLAPSISPGKSVEGAIASLLAAVIYGVALLNWLLPETPIWLAIVLALFGNIAGQVGDLAESAMKRGAGVKDSGTMLPGHGGWLDRLDSSLFSMPTVCAIIGLRQMF